MNVKTSKKEKRHENERFRLIAELVREGRRVGKAPWCCDGFIESAVYETLNHIAIEMYPQETMEETCARRKIEAKAQ